MPWMTSRILRFPPPLDSAYSVSCSELARSASAGMSASAAALSSSKPGVERGSSALRSKFGPARSASRKVVLPKIASVVAIASESGTRTPAAGGCRWHTGEVFLTEPDNESLRRLYAVPASPATPASPAGDRPFVRANFVTTVDGRLSGPDGTSSSINNAADKRVFDILRSLADAVLVGAGTVRSEGYDRLTAPPGGRAPALVVVSNSGVMPASVVDSPREDDGAPRGRAVLATHARAGAAEQSGVERLVCGDDAVDPAVLLRSLAERGVRSVLCEGGPQLFSTLLAAGLVDEVALTTAPALVGSVSATMLTTSPLDVTATWRGGAVIDGTLFALWRLTPSR